MSALARASCCSDQSCVAYLQLRVHAHDLPRLVVFWSRKNIRRESTVSDEVFRQALEELYQGEIIGEVILDQMLSFFSEPELKYKIAVLLQLETETKARLRPTLMRLGLEIAESDSSRELGLETAAKMRGKIWEETMWMLRNIVKPAVERYEEIAAEAPAEFQSIAQSMVIHEQSLYDFTELELAGDKENSLVSIIDQLEFKPLPQ